MLGQIFLNGTKGCRGCQNGDNRIGGKAFHAKGLAREIEAFGDFVHEGTHIFHIIIIAVVIQVVTLFVVLTGLIVFALFIQNAKLALLLFLLLAFFAFLTDPSIVVVTVIIRRHKAILVLIGNSLDFCVMF